MMKRNETSLCLRLYIMSIARLLRPVLVPKRFNHAQALKGSGTPASVPADVDPILWDDNRLVFFKPGALLYRGEQYDAISYQRLRDNCKCARCIDPSTRQKLHSSGSAASAKLSQAVKGFDAAGVSGVHATWSDSHASFYTEGELASMVAFNAGKTNVNHNYKRHFWDKDILEGSHLRMRYQDVDMLEMLRQVQVYGLVIISGVPTERTSDRDCELRAFMSRIGEIRNTFYGETWDVKSVENSKNVAYTTQDLGLHMDLL
jgi:gamma-butyrobetaine dioxygenase